MMKTLLLALCLILAAALFSEQSIAGGKCTGSTPCTACKNCSGCKYCKSGGTCGTCKTPEIKVLKKSLSKSITDTTLKDSTLVKPQ